MIREIIMAFWLISFCIILFELEDLRDLIELGVLVYICYKLNMILELLK